jgi:hypothetical protein
MFDVYCSLFELFVMYIKPDIMDSTNTTPRTTTTLHCAIMKVFSPFPSTPSFVTVGRGSSISLVGLLCTYWLLKKQQQGGVQLRWIFYPNYSGTKVSRFQKLSPSQGLARMAHVSSR